MNTSNSAVTMVSKETQSPLRYASDLIDEEWEILQPIIDELEPYITGHPRMTDLCEILNATFYLNKTGGICRKPFFPASLLTISNTGKSRNPDPTAAIIDSQSVKGTPEFYLESGFDGGKLIKGRNRYNGLPDYCSDVRSQHIRWESCSSAHNGYVLIPSYRHKNLGR